MGKNSRSFEEFSNQYPEFARMHSKLSPHKIGFGDKKQQRTLMRRLGISSAKLAVLGTALAATVALSLTIRVHSTLTNVTETSADVQARVIAEREEDKEAIVFFRLENTQDGTEHEKSFLTAADSTLHFDSLESGTRYLITYYAEASAKSTDAGGSPTEIVGRFAFTTLLPAPPPENDDEPPAPKQDDIKEQKDPSPDTSPKGDNSPAPTSTPTPSPTASPTAEPLPELQIVTESLADGQELLSYEQPIMVRYTGVNPLSFTLSGQLPAGLAFSSDGVLSGTPASGTKGTWGGLLITATDAVSGVSAEKTYSLAIGETKAINITNRFLKETKQTYKYSCQVTVDWQDTATLTYSASGLPNGLSINTSTGLITGRTSEATKNGAYSVSVTVSDTVSPAKASKVLELYVGLKPTPTPTPKPTPTPIPDIPETILPDSSETASTLTYYSTSLSANLVLVNDYTQALVAITNHDSSRSAIITGIAMVGANGTGSWSGSLTIAPGNGDEILFSISGADGSAADASVRYVISMDGSAINATGSVNAQYPGDG